MRDDAIIYQATVMYHQAVDHLSREHNCTYLAVPGEKVHVQLMVRGKAQVSLILFQFACKTTRDFAF